MEPPMETGCGYREAEAQEKVRSAEKTAEDAVVLSSTRRGNRSGRLERSGAYTGHPRSSPSLSRCRLGVLETCQVVAGFLGQRHHLAEVILTEVARVAPLAGRILVAALERAAVEDPTLELARPDGDRHVVLAERLDR